MTKSFRGFSGKKLADLSDSPDLKVRSLTNSVNLLLHGEPINKHDT